MGSDDDKNRSHSTVATQVPGQTTARDGLPSELDPGRPLGRYVYHSRVGSGGEGEVLAGHDPILCRPVALKRLRVRGERVEETRERLRHEARFNARLSHPNVVQVYDFYSFDGADFLVSEYVDGSSLAARSTSGRLALDEALRVAQGVTAGLEAAHGRGIIHRDLKSENVLVGVDGSIKIADFGVAIFSDLASGPSRVTGTYRAMSPEQSRGEPIDARSDLFALGILLYEILAGTSPFARDTVTETLRAIQEEAHRPLIDLVPGIPGALATLVDRLLEKTAGLRPQSAHEVGQELRRIVARTEQLASSERSGPSQLKQVAVATCRFVRDDSLSPIARAQRLNDAKMKVIPLSVRNGASVVAAYHDRVVLAFGYPEEVADPTADAAATLSELTRSPNADGQSWLAAAIDTGTVMVLTSGNESWLSGSPFESTRVLVERAEPGEILVSIRSQALLRRTFWLEPRSLGTSESASDLRAHYALRDRIDSSEAFEHAIGAPPIGREAELEALSHCWRDVAAGASGRTVWIEGEPGIGKTRLLHVVWHLAAESGARHVVVKVGAQDRLASLASIRALVARLLGVEPGAHHRAVLDALERERVDAPRGLSANLWELLSTEGSTASLDASLVERMLRAPVELVVAMASSRPLLIAVEDIHWMDPTSRRVFAAIAARCAELRLCLAVASREPLNVSEFPSKTIRLELGPLPAERASELLDSRLAGTSLHPQARRALLQASEGIPLVIEELVASAASAPDTEHVRSAPTSLGQSVASRLAPLGGARTLLETASIVGIEAPITLLADLASLEEKSFHDALRRAVESGLVELADDTRALRFRHALVRDSIAASLDSERIRAIHERVVAAADGGLAPWIAERPDLLARHCDGAAQHERAAKLWEQAADRASRLSAHTETFEQLSNALRSNEAAAAPDLAFERKIRSALVPILSALGGWADTAVQENHRRLAAIGQLAAESAPSLPVLWSRFVGGVVTHNLPELHDALRTLEVAPAGAVRDYLLACARGYLPAYDGYWRQAHVENTHALQILGTGNVQHELLEACGFEVMTFAHQQLAFLQVLRGNYDEVIRLHREAEALAAQGAKASRLNAWGYGVSFLLMAGAQGPLHEALSHCPAAMLSDAREDGLALYVAVAQTGAGRVDVLDQKRRRGLDTMIEGHDLLWNVGIRGGGQILYSAALAEAALEMNDLALAERALSQAMEYAHRPLGGYYLPNVYCLRGQLESARGESAKAALEFDQARQHIADLISRNGEDFAPRLAIEKLTSAARHSAQTTKPA